MLQRAVVLLCFFIFNISNINAATLFGIISERSAPEIAAGAKHFKQKYPHHQIILRTPEQLATESEQQLLSYINNADAILFAAIFGDSITRIKRLLKKSNIRSTTPLFATNSDQRITRLSRLNGQNIFNNINEQELRILTRSPDIKTDYKNHIKILSQQYPQQAQWLQARSYWQGRGSQNMSGLIAWLLKHSDENITVEPSQPLAAIRYYQNGNILQKKQLIFNKEQAVVVILDHNFADRVGDRDLLNEICSQIKNKNMQCIAILSRWGEASMQAVKTLDDVLQPATANIIISLQDFAIGGGQYRKKVTQLLSQLNVPVLKAIRLTDRTAEEWKLSTDGIPWDGVHYRVAMPELQGISQPMIVATASTPTIDKLTGLKLSPSQPAIEQVKQLTARVTNWVKLQKKHNSQKRVALIYYNHPPGRHNIGADNLDVPASLWEILNNLKKAGYDTGVLPKNQQALLDLIQQQGINLPNDQKALSEMVENISVLSAQKYQQWFATLSPRVQNEMLYGPLGYLQTSLFTALRLNKPESGKLLLQHVAGDIEHLLEGVDHPARQRALDLFRQFKQKAHALLQGQDTKKEIIELTKALHATGIEGLRGWGQAPGNVMVFNHKLLIPGIQFGNIFIGPQPPRGWELNEELLHANLSFPPTHQYLGFYYWLKHEFKADAFIHLGRHSTYEFLPQRRVGLNKDDYPNLISANIPGIYPYIVDGVGEGIQAKRRGLAVIIDHLTPPLNVTPLYDNLLSLRQLIESYESANTKSPTRSIAIKNIRSMIDEMKLRNELEKIMQDELKIRGISFDQIDDEMLVHEVGHYLTQMQEQFMPLGLHVYGKDWTKKAVDVMLESINQPEIKSLRQQLTDSPQYERQALLAGLNGQFIPPGKGNDPIRTPEALPTGRNFHALDNSLMPSRIAYELGLELAKQARKDTKLDPGGREAIILWASDTVRDEGVMVAFGLDMMGITPVWNSRGKLKNLKRLPMSGKRVRRDTLFTTSGLFRDLYANLLVWLDRAVLLALDGSSETIIKQYPELKNALNAALKPIHEMRQPGHEPLTVNQVAAHWVEQTQKLLKQNIAAKRAGRQASLRLFGDAPGGYGAGVNRLVERSASWQKRQEIGETYLTRMGHAYGIDIDGLPAHSAFKSNLKNVQNTYLGRSSNLYGLMDNNDAFDYMGGLSMVVESLSGKVPNNRVIQNANPENAHIQNLDSALLQELRGRFLNPAWLKALMQHDYAGARTMGSEFLEYLWGWQVTNPEIIKSWVWDEVKDVYMDDKHNLGLDKFLEQGHNVHVKTNMLAIMLVAAHKGFWQADEETLKELAEKFAQLVKENGLPGSGHTQAEHPMLEWIKPKIDVKLATALTNIQRAALGNVQPEKVVPTSIAELNVSDIEKTQKNKIQNELKKEQQVQELNVQSKLLTWLILLATLIILAGGFIHGRRS